MKTEALPQTDSIQELAQFWDTRDVTDFENELEEVTEPVFERTAVIQEEVTRCYAKYVFMDVVRFSNRSAEAQSEIVEDLNDIVRHALTAKKLNYDEDCILIPTGDGLCIALISPGMAYDIHVQIALAVLQLIQTHNDRTENESRCFQ